MIQFIKIFVAGWLIAAFGLLLWSFGDSAVRIVQHRMVYGYWFPYYREMTREDIQCTPPATINIKPGEYTQLPIETLVDWCGFRDEYEHPMVTVTGSPSNNAGTANSKGE
jgi:hypothetical protein